MFFFFGNFCLLPTWRSSTGSCRKSTNLEIFRQMSKIYLFWWFFAPHWKPNIKIWRFLRFFSLLAIDNIQNQWLFFKLLNINFSFWRDFDSKKRLVCLFLWGVKSKKIETRDLQLSTKLRWMMDDGWYLDIILHHRQPVTGNSGRRRRLFSLVRSSELS